MNSAQTLHAILRQVKQSNAATVLLAWEQILQTSSSTSEFVLRHAEVVRLVETIARTLCAVDPDEVTAAALTTYLPSWYRAVVWQSHWQSSQEPPAGIINADQLNYLALFGRVSAHEFTDKPALAEATLVTLRANLDIWIELLDEATELRDPLRHQLRTQVEHIRWLLDHVDLLGTSPVVRESQALLGQVTSAAAANPSHFTAARRWKAAIGGILFFLASAAGGTESANIALNNVHAMYSTITHWEQAALPVGGTTAAEFPAPGGHELTAGK